MHTFAESAGKCDCSQPPAKAHNNAHLIMKKKTQTNAAYSYAVMGFLIGLGLLAIIVFLNMAFNDQSISLDLVLETFRESPLIWVNLALPLLFGAFGYYTGNELQGRINDLSDEVLNDGNDVIVQADKAADNLSSLFERIIEKL